MTTKRILLLLLILQCSHLPEVNSHNEMKNDVMVQQPSDDLNPHRFRGAGDIVHSKSFTKEIPRLSDRRIGAEIYRQDKEIDIVDGDAGILNEEDSIANVNDAKPEGDKGNASTIPLKASAGKAKESNDIHEEDSSALSSPPTDSSVVNWTLPITNSPLSSPPNSTLLVKNSSSPTKQLTSKTPSASPADPEMSLQQPDRAPALKFSSDDKPTDQLTDDEEIADSSLTAAVIGGFGILGSVLCCICYRRMSGDGLVPRIFSDAFPPSRLPEYHQPYQGVATTDDNDGDVDEWGWNDDDLNTVGDMELSTKKKEEPPPIPTARNGMTLTGSGTISKKSPPPFPKKKTVVPSTSADRRGSASRENEAASTSLRNSLSESLNHQSSTPIPISSTSLSLSSSAYPQVPPALPPSSKRHRDDIFAEMGLSVQPTFSKTSTAPKAALVESHLSDTSLSTTRSVAAARANEASVHNPFTTCDTKSTFTPSQATPVASLKANARASTAYLPFERSGGGTASNWDDDSDLDDLLID